MSKFNNRRYIENQEDTITSYLFFSQRNIDNLMIKIQNAVYNNTEDKIKIPKQNIFDLIVVMKAIYLKYAKHNSINLKEQIDALNERVLAEIMTDVIENAVSMYKYKNTNFDEFIPMPLPKRAGMKGKKVYSNLYG